MAASSNEMGATEHVPRLRMEGMTKDYGGTRVVDDVTSNYGGRVLGLIGENAPASPLS